MSTWSSPPIRLPSSKPTHTSSSARGFSLSLLDSSPVPPPVDHRPPPPKLQQHPETASTQSTSYYYNDLIQQVTHWKMEMEQVRDDIYFLQIQNSQSLDALCMAGADIMPNDGAAAASVRGEEEDSTSD